MKNVFRVVNCGEMFSVKSEKSENGILNKRNLVLQELGGKYEDQFVVSLLGNLAICQYYPGDIVYGVLRFQVREYNQQTFQDIVVNDLIKLSK